MCEKIQVSVGDEWYTRFRSWTESYIDLTALNVSKSSVNHYAEEQAKAIGFGPERSIFDLVERLGGRVAYFNMDFSEFASLDGTLFVHDPAGDDTNGVCFDIVLPLHTGELRNRFTIAHELGHYLIHARKGEEVRTKAARGRSTPVEWEANWFAAG
ncbi:MAG: ImmA/IrrE family metallo-endopeptidase, partial [Planctomycetota bacterium]